jgi:hypothetical protein
MENPLEWLTQTPGSYAGELSGNASPETLPPGSWSFDRQSHELVYVPDHAEYFEPGKDGRKWIRFRAHFVYEAAGQRRNKVMSGVVFGPVEPYKWLIPKNG